MSNKNTGGPAFPCDLAMYDQEVVDAMQGMTLRDYFAAKAMQSTLADDAYIQRTVTTAEWLAIVAKSSYEIADAMLKARQA